MIKLSQILSQARTNTLVVSLIAWCLGSTAAAHHSTAANFDRNSIISVAGVITEFRFQNPHVQILLDVTTESGDTESWMVELSAKNQLIRGGWTGEEFAVGQNITVFGWEGYRERSTFLRRAILPDGTELEPPRPVTVGR